MPDHRDQVDLRSLGVRSEDDAQGKSPARRFLGVHFRCAGAYARAYLDDAGESYCAKCPRCAAPIRFAVGQGGTRRRTFEASCSQ